MIVGRPTACFVVGCGPSLTRTDLAPLAHLPVFGINRVWRAGLPRLDWYYWSDQPIWDEHETDIRRFVARGGRAWCYDAHGFPVGEPVQVVTGRAAHGVARSGPIRQGGSSAHAACNLAWRLGVRRIYLVGMDLRLDGGRRYPWGEPLHADEQKHWSAHYVREQLPHWASLMAWMEGAGGALISCSPASVLNDVLGYVGTAEAVERELARGAPAV